MAIEGFISIISSGQQGSEGSGGGGTRLCGIYLREVASFLPCREVNKLRQVSQHSLTSITRLPRRHYEGLTILWNGQPIESPQLHGKSSFCMKDVGGKAGETVVPCSVHGEPLDSVEEDCCPHLKDIARGLVGQRIVPEMADNFDKPALMIRLNRKQIDDADRGAWIDFRTESNLISDERVAFDQLHFLAHLDGASFSDVITMIHDFRHQPIQQPLNPLIFELLNIGKESLGEAPFCIYTRVFVLFSLDVPDSVEEVRRVWRGLFGRPLPQLLLHDLNEDEGVPWGDL